MTDPKAELYASDLTGAIWRKASASGAEHDCVEIADNVPALVPVRDSKRPTGPPITFSPEAWRAFIAHLD
ncbi:DUF397 domain-containing protein [Streptomyces flaveus]|uniref:DUF397 domain-containing protein n=1 Tax=Streptomyces flaveus TaxID=66370 RepID=A0A917VLQ0_9ACTN|nr:DUF397 domain-containing protein [Streptomyces flaveus]GGK93679.1 hypothetical protein GCM10010094_63070 [Streptomyces flaveus]